MQISLSSGNYRIISSGQTFLFGESNELKIDSIADNGFKFAIHLIFESDETGEQKITSVVQENRITLSCFNFCDMGTGLSKPVHIAAGDGSGIWFMFWSYLEGSSSAKVRSVKYTFFMNNDMEDDIVEG